MKTVVGLSNISNGCPKEIRPLINQVFGVLAFGAGLDAAIIDAKDLELVRIFRMLENNTPQTDIDRLYIHLAAMVSDFGEVDDIDYDKNSYEQVNIIKIVRILLNKEIYSHSFTQI